MSYQYYLYDLEGVLYRKDKAVIEFCIKDRQLISYKVLSHDDLPYDLYVSGVSYNSFNEFFKYRVVLDNSQDIRYYLNSFNLAHYDFNELVVKNNGWNHLDYYWVRFTDKGASSWKEICTQRYPIC